MITHGLANIDSAIKFTITGGKALKLAFQGIGSFGEIVNSLIQSISISITVAGSQLAIAGALVGAGAVWPSARLLSTRACHRT